MVSLSLPLLSLWLVLPPPLFGGLGLGSLLPGFACLFSVTSSFFSLVFSSVSCVLVLSWFPCLSLLLSRAEPRSFVSFLPPFPACLCFRSRPAPRFFSSFLRLLVVFLARFFVCLARSSFLLLSPSHSVLLSRAETRSNRLSSAPPWPRFLLFSESPLLVFTGL